MPPARVLVNREHYEELRRIIRDLGDEPLGGKIARAIIRAREQEDLEDVFVRVTRPGSEESDPA